ncbi:MAG: glycine cleavage system aminomethyltransferase GcvT [Desulfuromonadales bacterium]|nr:glycine cleavage system aminomethyltransferase GcvT [Desulfuromonadales bacterium]
MDEILRITPLNSRHRSLNAQMAPFGGWDMPIQYGGIIAEHGWCREKAALFDICHMGEFLFEGDFEEQGLEDLFTFSVKTIPLGRSRYGFLLNDQGGVIDDLIVFRLGENRAMVVVNAATIATDFSVITNRLRGGSFTDITDDTGKVDLQGPLARRIMMDLFGEQIERIPYFTFVTLQLLGCEALVSRTGYTGELGYEIFLPAGKVGELWDLLLGDERVRPAGLGARDLLRLEMGYSLYGHDIDETISPLEAGLEPFVKFGKEFVGKQALLQQKEQGLTRMKVAFQVDGRRSPRQHYDILSNGEQVGVVTSGAFSPTLGRGIGIGLVRSQAAGIGTRLSICHERVSMAATVCELPFYSDGSLRS